MTDADGHDRAQEQQRSCPGCGSPMRHVRRLVSYGLPCDYSWHGTKAADPPLTAELRMCFGICDHVDCLP